jgi:hypothetical protein
MGELNSVTETQVTFSVGSDVVFSHWVFPRSQRKGGTD